MRLLDSQVVRIIGLEFTKKQKAMKNVSIVLAILLSGVKSSAAPFTGGLIVVIQGLTTSDIEVGFSEAKQVESVKVTLLSMEGEIVHRITQNELEFDFSNFNIPTGTYQLIVELNNTVKEIEVQL